jgi:APA family basic amino acid/polyamine antiporter
MHSSAELPRKLGLFDSAAIVVGTIIGGGIFLVPNLVARSLPSAPWIVAVWIFTGVLSFLGALAYAELGAMIPHTGGQYVFLREAYGPLLAFLCGWTQFFVIVSASIAWLGINFATYLGHFFPIGPVVRKAIGIALIAAVTAINYRGVTLGAVTQNIFTVMKVAGLAVLVGAAFFGRHRAPAAEPAGEITLAGFGVAMIACLTSYDGWVVLSSMAGEVKYPKRNLPLALALGVGAAIAVYVTTNVAYLRVLGVGEIARAERVGALAAERVMGSMGAAFVSLTVLVSIVGAANGWAMTGPRLFFAQARDGLLFRRLAAVHPRFQTPYLSILLLGVWSALLAVTGTYYTLAVYAMYASWVFYLLTSVGVLLLRRAQPDTPRPYRMTGYPATLGIFALVALGFVVSNFYTAPGPTLVGTVLIAAGIPVYFWWKRGG